MPSPYRLYQIDAFTDRRFAGNPAGVVPNADGLGEAEMQAIARELNNSETAFIFAAEGPDHDVRVRFFTPTTEVPICGHATISAHYVRALEGAPDGVTRQLSGIGILPVEILRDSLGEPRIRMTQRDAEFGKILEDAHRARLAAALGIEERDFAGFAPIQIVTTGHSKVMVPLSGRRLLDGLRPDMLALARLSGDIGCNGFYAFTLADPEPGFLAHGRMFSPAIGVAEDPVTGNASGPLGAYLLTYGPLKAGASGRAAFSVRQGEAMGRPGSVDVEVSRPSASGPISVRITGRAVVAFRTELSL